MGHKQEIALRIWELEAHFCQNFLGVFSGCNNLCKRFFQISTVRNRSNTSCNRGLIHGIRIKGEFAVIQYPNQSRVGNGKSNPHSCHRTGLREGMYHNQIIVFVNQRQYRCSTEVNICFINDDNAVWIVLNDVLNICNRQSNARWCIRIREYNAAIFCIIIFFHQFKAVIQRLFFIRNLEQFRPYRIESICDIRKENRLFRVEKRQKAHRKHII